MKFLIVASCLLALAAATPGYLGAGPVAYSAASPFAYGAAPVAYAAAPAHVAYAAAPVAYSAAAVAPASVSTQHHAQDTLGQYNYGYSDSNSAKQEVRTADGITRGGYSYVDGNGLVQSTSYVSDALGFRVAATNLPVGPAPVVAAAPAVVGAAIVGPAETPEVIAARAAHFNAHAVAKANLLGRKKRSPGYLGAAIAAPAVAAYAAPAVATYAAPAIAYAAPAVVPVHNFGYSSASVHPAQVVPASPNVVAPAVAAYAAPAINAYAAHGVVAAHGIVAAPGVVGAAIVGPAETPEVVAARAAHFEAHAIAKANLLGRKKRSPGYLGAAYATPAVAAYAAPAVATYAAPAIAYAAPAVVPVHNFGYSSASVHPAQVVAAAPAVAAYAAPAVYANAYTAHAIAKSHLLG